MTQLELRPPSGVLAAFACGSTNSSTSAKTTTTTTGASTGDGGKPNASSASSSSSKPTTTSASGGDASSQTSSSDAPTIRYTRNELTAVRDAESFNAEIPVELATSTLEIVKNEINADIEKKEGSVWGRHVKEDMKPKTTRASEEGEEGESAAVPAPVASAVPAPVSGKSTTNGGGGGKTTTPAPAQVSTQGGGVVDAEKAKRTMKGVLNKMTAETADKLTEQLLSECRLDSDASAAKTLVSMILDKCAFDGNNVGVYADVCARLATSLPAYAESEGAPARSFKKLLLSACQDEFESLDAQREGLSAYADRSDREAQGKRVKLRTVGTVRLIGELVARGVVGAAVAHAVADELLGEARSVPGEDYVEALCALLTACGKELEAGAKKVMNAYLARVNVLAESEQLEARSRFMCRDVIDLATSGWTSKKSTTSGDKKTYAGGKGAADAENASPIVSDELLFPQGPAAARSTSSGPLSGPYRAPTHDVVLPTQANRAALDASLRAQAKARAEAKADAAMNAAAGGASTSDYTEEQVEQKIKSFIDEYATVGDVSEALLCIADLVARTPDGEATKGEIAKSLVDYVVNVSTAKAAELVGKLLAACNAQGGFSTSAIEAAVGDVVAMMDDIAIDVPMAPKLMAKVVAAVVGANAVALDFITAAGGCIEDVMYRREFAGACLVELKSAGYPGLKPGALNLGEFAAGEPGVDETVADWLSKLSLSELA
jgi:translation initiation factor 4G